MKIFSLLLIAISLSISSFAWAQGCPIPCWRESFPYWFCPVTGGIPVVLCSTNPDSMPGFLPSKTHMPGNVFALPIDTSLWYQPDSAIPVFTETPPDKEAMWDHYMTVIIDNISDWTPPWMFPYDSVTSVLWDDDESCYDASLDQWELDSTNFFKQLPQSNIDISGLDSNARSFFSAYYDQDHYWLFYLWGMAYSAYQRDSIRHFTGNDVSYTQVFSSGGATSDAFGDLNAWLAVCSLTGDPSCHIYINPDNNTQNWKGNYVSTPGNPANFALGLTFGDGSYCQESSCADPTIRYIIYNATNSFFYKNNNNFVILNQGYILHPSAPLRGWFTGNTEPSGPYGVYAHSDFSFQQVIEHEEGHYLDLNHPSQVTSDSASCINNQTQCSESMVMAAGLIQPGIDPIGLQPDDKCLFQKLYCPGTGDDGVQEVEAEPPSPEIFPNPTTGACQLQYVVTDRSLVQLALYDQVGKQVRFLSHRSMKKLALNPFLSARKRCRPAITSAASAWETW